MFNTIITRIKNLLGFKSPEVTKEFTASPVVQEVKETTKVEPVKKAKKPRAKKAKK